MATEKKEMVAIVGDDDLMRSALQGRLKSVGLPSEAFASAEEFLTAAPRLHNSSAGILGFRSYLLTKPLRISVGAVKMVTGLVKLELAGLGRL